MTEAQKAQAELLAAAKEAQAFIYPESRYKRLVAAIAAVEREANNEKYSPNGNLLCVGCNHPTISHMGDNPTDSGWRPCAICGCLAQNDK